MSPYIFYFIIFFFLSGYAYLAYKQFPFALAGLFLLLPAYLIRFTIFGLPTTFLEMMIFVITAVWLYKIIFLATTHSIFNFIQKKTGIGDSRLANLIDLLGHSNPLKTLKNIVKAYPTPFITATGFVLAAGIGIFVSIDWWKALGEWRAFYFEPFLVFIIIVSSGLTKNDLRLVWRALIFGGLITALLAIYQHFTGWLVPHAFWANRDTYRVTAWYGYPNAVGLFLTPIIPLAIYEIQMLWRDRIQKTTKRHKISWNLSLIASAMFVPAAILAIFFAKGAGPILATGASLGFILLFTKRWRVIASSLGIITLAIIYLLPLVRPIRDEFFFHARSPGIRWNMWAETVEFLAHNQLFGAGLASYPTKIAPYHIDKTVEIYHLPHNLMLSIWVNAGVLGLVSFLWFVVNFCRFGIVELSVHRPVTREMPLYLLSSMLAILVMGLVDTPILKNDLALVFWLLPTSLISQISAKKFGAFFQQKIDQIIH